MDGSPPTCSSPEASPAQGMQPSAGTASRPNRRCETIAQVLAATGSKQSPAPTLLDLRQFALAIVGVAPARPAKAIPVLNLGARVTRLTLRMVAPGFARPQASEIVNAIVSRQFSAPCKEHKSTPRRRHRRLIPVRGSQRGRRARRLDEGIARLNRPIGPISFAAPEHRIVAIDVARLRCLEDRERGHAIITWMPRRVQAHGVLVRRVAAGDKRDRPALQLRGETNARRRSQTGRVRHHQLVGESPADCAILNARNPAGATPARWPQRQQTTGCSADVGRAARVAVVDWVGLSDRTCIAALAPPRRLGDPWSARQRRQTAGGPRGLANRRDEPAWQSDPGRRCHRFGVASCRRRLWRVLDEPVVDR